MRFLPTFLSAAICASSLFSTSSAQTAPNFLCQDQLPAGVTSNGAGPFKVTFSSASFVPGGSAIQATISGSPFQYFMMSAVSDIYPPGENFGDRRSGAFVASSGTSIVCENGANYANAIISSQAVSGSSAQVTWNPPSSASTSLVFYTTVMVSSTEAYTIATYLPRAFSSSSSGGSNPSSSGSNGPIVPGTKYWGVNIGSGSGRRPPNPNSRPVSSPSSFATTAASASLPFVQPSVPSARELSYYLQTKNMNLIRFPVSWELLQPALGQPLNATMVQDLSYLVQEVMQFNGSVVLDLHNFGQYKGEVIGAPGSSVTASNFADVWGRIASVSIFNSNPSVIFGLMNQPHDIKSELWIANVNAALASIRSAQANNLVLIPGNGWSRVANWVGSEGSSSTSYGTSNGVVMVGEVDNPYPGNHAYDVNQFFDSDWTGTSDECSVVDPSPLFANFLIWLRNNNKKAFLTAIGSAANENCHIAVTIALRTVVTNPDVFLGWAWWLAGSDSGSASYSIQPSPSTGADAPQMAYLEPFLNAAPVSGPKWNESVVMFLKTSLAPKNGASSSMLSSSSWMAVMMLSVMTALFGNMH